MSVSSGSELAEYQTLLSQVSLCQVVFVASFQLGTQKVRVGVLQAPAHNHAAEILFISR